MTLVLASRSPQRRALLRAAGVEHRVVTSRYGEDDIPGLTPAELAAAHAAAKARDVAGRLPAGSGGPVLGADTVVAIDGRAIGKPADRAGAAGMLALLAGRRHVVATAVCLIVGGAEDAFVDETAVVFRPYGPELVEWYLERGEWQGRAGAYAIQGAGALLVERVDGDFTTVVGLPIGRLVTLLEARGLVPWSPHPHAPGA